MARGSPRLSRFRRAATSAFTSALAVCATLLAFGGLALAIFFYQSASAALAPSAVMSAAGFATLGWLVTAFNQRALSRKQHTLNLLIQMRHSEIYRKQLNAINDMSPEGTALTARHIAIVTRSVTDPSAEETAFSRAVIYILNYFEFICAAIIVGDLDGELMRRTIRAHLVTLHDKFSPLIDDERRSGNATTYTQLRQIAAEWRTKPEEARRQKWRTAEAAATETPSSPVGKTPAGLPAGASGGVEA